MGGYIIKRAVWVRVLVLGMAALLAWSCMPRSAFLYEGNKVPDIVVESLETSEEKPMELCGLGDLYAVLTYLRCANGQKFYSTPEAGLEKQDQDYSAKSLKGHEVLKFEGACYDQKFTIYMTIESCDIDSQPQGYDADIWEPEKYDPGGQAPIKEEEGLPIKEEELK